MPAAEHARIPGLVLVAPTRGMQAVVRSASWPLVWAMLGCLAASWSALSFALHADGRAPSGPLLLPIARGDYYLAQAIFVAPLFAGATGAAAMVSGLVGSALGGSPTRLRVSAAIAATAVSVPAIVAWVVPDALALSAFGFDALASIARWCAPLALAWTLALFAVGVRVARGLAWPRAFVTALAAVVAFAAVVMPFLR